ncbi:MAG: hypothetical protein GXO48_06245, partial [Chlorobi bacterium]|nr:hypothetical protein [Chlorobiota bacterium]
MRKGNSVMRLLPRKMGGGVTLCLSVSFALLGGSLNAQNVGVGTTSPQSRLHIIAP